MIDLNDDNDPMLFSVQLPTGDRLVVQYMEVMAELQSFAGDAANPDISLVLRAIRSAARTKAVASTASDASLVAAWYRMTDAVNRQGNA
jgi:hypothetical protein